ncbi:Rieske (2Fe-2S) protein [Tsukamurella paurometabola]|uniref:Rieske (2Fe-2S) iron-sulfur domain protein n=1 Tax=Tsukamurella paurometabola (strain ATCC 8368 / DSM 20162 / CCUG 35730 / CIP 100753 / JCM 10117 / KCTC 9821 / NBRC 16120 / NCIMB 702349 / NCTC 13040) TaxID=521096 RepID=D5UPR0_TSUPD|nr:Rieske (2Fe-2S) protein [Tsukamurella paurometabola]ADG78816.1 Rieske (2Fe-2S) iron-sulfur domain protein [Tsukamurella paurometabola DSM 20162]SUP33228.1 Digoxigenin ferredoxin subunit [Tsukamurella paurometabola]
MTQTTQPVPAHESTLLCPSRRAVLSALPGIALVPVLAACGGGEGGGDGTATPAGGGTRGPGAGAATVAAAQVPVGSAVVIAGPTPYVVAQPAVGTYVAFNAACTHKGTTVAASDGLELECPAHGSTFDGATGAATKGPATDPLTAVTVRLDGDTLVVG